MRRQLTMGSLFSGGGGWEAGLLPLGFKPNFAVELETPIAQLYDWNFPGHVINAGVQTVDVRKMPKVDLLVSSPPCQDYSKTGKAMHARKKKGGWKTSKTREACDPRIGLVTLEFVRHCQPSVVMIENVIGYLTDPRTVLWDLLNGLSDLGYSVNEPTVLDAWKYGVPSGRQRLIIIAKKRGSRVKLAYPRPGKASAWYPAVKDLIKAGALPQTTLAKYNRYHLKHRPPPASGYPVLLSGSTSSMVHPKLTWRTKDQIGWTVTTARSTSSMKILTRAGKVYKVTPRVAARLQGWPDWYDFSGVSQSLALHVIGNSMPPLLAQRLAKTVWPGLHIRRTGW